MTDAAEQRAYHHGNLRAELLDEAVAQLTHTPVEQLSLRALARSLGVSQTAPYRHFSDKDSLLAAIAVRAYEDLLELLLTARAEAGERAEDQLRAVGRAYIDFAGKTAQVYKLMFGPLVQPGAEQPELRDASRKTLDMVHDTLAHGIHSGEFEAPDTIYLANAAWASLHGLATLLIDSPTLFRDHIDLQRQYDTSVDAFLNGVKAAG